VTTEIAVLNREGVALASDSAATFPDRNKTHIAANKLFALSEREPVGIMVYGSSGIGRAPWETAIKMFRRHLGSTQEPRLDGYVRRFLAYLGERGFVSGDEEASLVRRASEEFLTQTQGRLRERIVAILASGRTAITADEFWRAVQESLRDLTAEQRSLPPIHDNHRTALASFRRDHAAIVHEVVKGTFAGVAVPPAVQRAAVTLVAEYALRQTDLRTASSGVVIAGFGEDDVLPVLHHLRVQAAMNGRVRAWPVEPPYEVERSGARVIPFAQREMAMSFLTGVLPDYQVVIESTVATLINRFVPELLATTPGLSKTGQDLIRRSGNRLSDTQLRSALDALSTFQGNLTSSILDILANLPKEELAALAALMINLSSLRRRMSASVESVAGPVDVAVISKGDGMVWVSRKHYFDPGLNPRYFANTYGSRS
jgi:hypothetical protein